jgi:rod shape-determining protein MreD
MPQVSKSATEVEIFRINPLIYLLAALFTLVLQSFLPLYVRMGNLLDFPLLIIIHFGLTRRNPVLGLLAGALLGMAQDTMTRGPVGMLGSVKTVIGYGTAFCSVWFDVENRIVRFLIIFASYMMQTLLLFSFQFLLLGEVMEVALFQRLLAGFINSAIGMIIFILLDRFRRQM